MSRRAAGLLLFLLAGIAVAQSPSPRIPQGGPRVYPAPPSLLQQFDVTAGTVQELNLPNVAQQGFVIDVSFAGVVRQLRLDPVDVRAPGFRLLVADQNGMHEVPAPPSVTFRGGLVDDPDTDAAASVDGGSLRAIVRMPGGLLWAIQPVRDVNPTAGPLPHVVFRNRDNVNLGVSCGAQGAGQVVTSTAFPDVNSVCQLACEADFPFYQLNGSNVTTTQNDITTVINNIDVIYRRDVQIQYTITTIVVRTTTDPYSSTASGTLLAQFGNYWNATQGATVRDTAHLFTGRNLDGSVIGVAYLGVVCNVGNAYGLVESRYTPNMTSRTSLSTHEIGHNWNAGHCNGQPDCGVMCSGLGGCSGAFTTFGVSEKNQILAFKATLGCLTLAQTTPVINTMVPSSVRTFQPAQVTLNGTGFTGVTRVNVGTAVLNPGGFTFISDTQMRINPPEGLAIGFVGVNATNPSGTSNNAVLTYTVTSPPDLAVPPAVVGGSPLTWRFGGLQNHGFYLLVGITNQTAPWQGWPLMQGYSVLMAGMLSPTGIGSHTVPVPPTILNGITVYSQMLDVDFTQLQLTGTTAVRGTTIYF